MNRNAFSQSMAIDLHAVDERQPLKILLAESDPQMRRLLAAVLRSDGHEVVEAADGAELLEAIASLIIDGDKHQFDLIIAAQGIPGIPGLSVLSGLRARGRTTPFVLMTDNPGVQAHARRLGGVVLDKPLNVERIRSAVRNAEEAES
jgi:CheY-like chemotaxis protein